MENAKTRLVCDLSELSSDLPRLPIRQGDYKSMKEVEDIVRLLNYADEHLFLSKLPTYVVNKSTMLPPVSLCEGDLNFLFEKLRRLEESLNCHGSCLAKLSTIVESVSAQLSAPSVRQQFDGLSRTTPPSSGIVYNLVGQSERTTTSRDSITSVGVNTQSAAPTATRQSASVPKMSTGISNTLAIQGSGCGNKFSVLAGGAATDTDKTTSDGDDFTVVENSKKTKKRRRTQQSSPVSATSYAGIANKINNGQTASVNKKGPLVVGCAEFAVRSWSSTEQKFYSPIKAAPSAAKKKILYVDNLDRTVTTEQLSNFVRGFGVEVLSCFSAQPRKRYRDLRPTNDTGVIDRSAFRLGILERDLDKVLDSDLWPSGVLVSEWRFKRTRIVEDTNHAGIKQRESLRVRNGSDLMDLGTSTSNIETNTSLIVAGQDVETAEVVPEDEAESTVILNSTLISSALETAPTVSAVQSEDINA